MTRSGTGALALALALCLGLPATAKPLGPGDVRVCDSGGCEPIEDRRAVRELASFLYAGPEPERVVPPRAGMRSFELRLRLGRTIGVVSGRWLSRARIPRLNCDRFRGNGWYRLPPEVAVELRTLIAGHAGTPFGPPPRRSC